MTTENEPENMADKAAHDHKPIVYKVLIDKMEFFMDIRNPTGSQLLEKAGKIPVEKFALYLKGRSHQPERIGLTQEVELREHEVEKFVTLPLDQTEG
jgi:hypothetical protein